MEVPVGRSTIRDFSDREIFVKIEENVRGADVFVIQSTCNPGNTNLMEMLVMIDALKRSSAKRITAVLPYYGYARQDRKVEPRVPITAKLVANLLETAGTDRVLTIDLHAGQIGYISRRRRRGTGAGVCETTGSFPGDYRQTPGSGQRGKSHAHHR
jgi:ribose-phosphate pyrophosphokinase